jgi:hypothetical protein
MAKLVADIIAETSKYAGVKQLIRVLGDPLGRNCILARKRRPQVGQH